MSNCLSWKKVKLWHTMIVNKLNHHHSLIDVFLKNYKKRESIIKKKIMAAKEKPPDLMLIDTLPNIMCHNLSKLINLKNNINCHKKNVSVNCPILYTKLGWKVHMRMSYRLMTFFDQCDQSTATPIEEVLCWKRKIPLVTFHESILISLWTFNWPYFEICF